MKVVFFFISLLFYSTIYAAIPFEGWYVGFLVGPTFPSDLNFNFRNPLTRVYSEGQITYNPSVNGGGQIGFRYDKFRAEAEFVFNNNSLHQINNDGVSITSTMNSLGLSGTGSTSYFATLVNVYYEFHPVNKELRWVPFVGVGGGYAWMNNKVNLSYYQYEFFNRDVDVSSPVGQAIVGVNYLCNDTHSIGLDFRYMSTPNHQILDTRFVVESVNLVVNLSFD